MKAKHNVIPNQNPHLGGLMPTPDWKRYFELQASLGVTMNPAPKNDHTHAKVKTYVQNLKRTTER